VATVLTLIGAKPLRRYAVPVILGGVAFVAVALAVFPQLNSRVAERRSAERSVWERRNIDAAALRMILDHPIAGVGLVSFSEHSETYFRQPSTYPLVAELKIGVHNVFLLLGTEIGLLGLTLFLLSFTLAIGRGLVSRAPPDLEPWRIGLIAIALCWVVTANFAPLGHVFADSITWLWAGVVLAGSVEAGRPPPRLPAERAASG
jgi:O-antigen ligase